MHTFQPSTLVFDPNSTCHPSIPKLKHKEKTDLSTDVILTGPKFKFIHKFLQNIDKAAKVLIICDNQLGTRMIRHLVAERRYINIHKGSTVFYKFLVFLLAVVVI